MTGSGGIVSGSVDKPFVKLLCSFMCGRKLVFLTTGTKYIKEEIEYIKSNLNVYLTAQRTLKNPSFKK